MKALVLIAVFAAPLFVAAPAAAVKGDLSSAPSKMTASPQKGLEKPAPSTSKRVLQLQLKK